MDTNPHIPSNDFYPDYEYDYEYELYAWESHLEFCSTHSLALLDGECYVCEDNLLIAEQFLEELDAHLPTTVLFSPGDRMNKDRKSYLEKQRLINCGRCPYHRAENATYRRRNPHDKRRVWKDC